MENRFDELAKELAGGLSRREALRRLGGGLAGALLASVGLVRESWAAPRADCRNYCGQFRGPDKKQCTDVCLNCPTVNCLSGPAGGVVCCGSGQACCGGACVDTGTSPTNCGGCGITCTGGRICSGGGCVCPDTQVPCDGFCVDTGTDARNCGACRNICSGTTDTCSGGVCGCGSGPACTGGLVCSGGSCVCPGGSAMCANGACCPVRGTDVATACLAAPTDVCPSGYYCAYPLPHGNICLN